MTVMSNEDPADPSAHEPRVTDAPETVWLVYGDLDHDATHRECCESGEVTWCEDAQFSADVRYLRADLLYHLARENEQLRRQSNLDAMRVGKLAEDVERYSALHARLFAEKTAAQIDAESMRELLYRMLEAPTTQISPSWKEEIRPALVAPGCKTPDGCRENGCLGWCDEHRPEGPKP